MFWGMIPSLFGIGTSTETVGGGAPASDNTKMPWYVVTGLVVAGVALIVMAGSRLMKKAGF